VDNIKAILPLLTLIVGLVVGFISNVILTYIRQKHDITIKIIEQYFKAREELCDQLSVLAALKSDQMLSENEISKVRQELLKLYYKYYDFMPIEVLHELNCLHACLGDKQHRLFKYYDNKVLLLKEPELSNFIERITFVDNLRYFAKIALNVEDESKRMSSSLNFQAKSVLRAINDTFTIKNLMSWVKFLPKNK
jgi:hypothetical protein